MSISSLALQITQERNSAALNWLYPKFCRSGMHAFIEDDPYKRYKAIKVAFQSSLRSKVVVQRRDNPEERYLMVIAPKAIRYKNDIKIENNIMEQVEKLLNLSHPNLVKVFEAYDHNGYCYWVMEDWFSERNTHGFGFGSLTEGQVAIMVKNLASAVRYLHMNDLVHGSLSFDDLNFFMSGDPDQSLDFQIVDLGMGRYVDEVQYMKLLRGRQLRYGNPPEVMEGKFTKKGDVWSIGAIAFRFLTGDVNPIPLSERMEEYRETLASSEAISPESKDFVLKCLMIDPSERIGCDVILEHPWFDIIGQQLKQSVLDSSIVENLNRVHNNTKFKEVASQIVADFVDREELVKFKKTFSAIDTDGTGKISHDKFVEALKGYIPEEKLTDLFLLIDKNGTGRIAYDEFVGVVIQFKEDIAEQQLIQAFHNMDTDGSGAITAKNLADVMEISEGEALEIMHSVVPRVIKNPKIDQHMFVNMFRKKKGWLNAIVKRGCE